MAVSEHWRYQGRQYHQWFGHGTAPKEEKEAEPAKPGSLFDPLSVGQRVDYASSSVVAQSPRDQRSGWEARVGGTNRDSLKTAIAVWYGAWKLSRTTFRQRLLDPNTDDETVDRLGVQRGVSWMLGPTPSSALLVRTSPQQRRRLVRIGWPRFIGDAERGCGSRLGRGNSGRGQGECGGHGYGLWSRRLETNPADAGPQEPGFGTCSPLCLGKHANERSSRVYQGRQGR
jgi:hypothetical protein